jgi:hypothetical protein
VRDELRAPFACASGRDRQPHGDVARTRNSTVNLPRLLRKVCAFVGLCGCTAALVTTVQQGATSLTLTHPKCRVLSLQTPYRKGAQTTNKTLSFSPFSPFGKSLELKVPNPYRRHSNVHRIKPSCTDFWKRIELWMSPDSILRSNSFRSKRCLKIEGPPNSANSKTTQNVKMSSGIG